MSVNRDDVGRETYRNLRLDGVDVYFRTRIAEVGIESEYISVGYISAWRHLLQDPQLPARQALQRPPQFRVLCVNKAPIQLDPSMNACRLIDTRKVYEGELT